MGSRVRVLVLPLALPIAFSWVACLQLDPDPAADANDASTASAPDVASGGADVTNGGTDVTTQADAIGDVVVPIDPFDAPDGFEAAGPDAPVTCASSGFACAAVAPAGWTGPFSLYEGNLANAPSCGAVTQMLAANGSLAAVPPAQCAACDCNPATGAHCSNISVYGKRGDCSGTGSSSSLAINTCVNMGYGTALDPDGYNANALGFTASTVSGGSCTPKVAKPTPVNPPYTWNVVAVGCNTLVGSTPGCTAGKVCSAIPDPPFNAKLCIGKDGDIPACPGAPYSRRVLYYKGVTDDRDCGACSCDPPPSGGNCSVVVTSGTAFGCANPENTGAAPGCVAHEPGYYNIKATATVPALSCAAKGGAPSGTVTPANPVTVCCEP